MPTAASRRTSIGRPPAGLRAGECVRDYPQVSIRIPPETRDRLNAISRVTAKPQWRIVSEALDCYFREQPEHDRRLIRHLCERANGRSG
jgi:predicted DNA-binding protein